MNFFSFLSIKIVEFLELKKEIEKIKNLSDSEYKDNMKLLKKW